MTFPFLPWAITDALTDLDPQWLHRHGIRLLMLDFDNTIVPYTTDVPADAMRHWLRQAREAGILLCVVSNSRNDRVKRFCQAVDLPCITGAKKPGTSGIRRCMETYRIPAEECALVGDQIYTDTLGANLAGVRPILVRSIHNHTIWLKLRHAAEMPFILAGRKRRIRK